MLYTAAYMAEGANGAAARQAEDDDFACSEGCTYNGPVFVAALKGKDCSNCPNSVGIVTDKANGKYTVCAAGTCH